MTDNSENVNTKRPIFMRQQRDGIGCDGPGITWRAYGEKADGKRFALVDNRYECAYPLDCSTERQLRRQCALQYPGHPLVVERMENA